LKEAVHELCVLIQPHTIEGLELTIDMPDHLLRVQADRHLLLQATLNVANNAFRAMRSAAVRQLRIEVREDPHLVNMRIWNSAAGPWDPDALFSPFQPGAEGDGLGLFLARAIIRSFGGNIRFEPSLNGCGFVFELIPAEEDADKAHA
jgi:C4-dicarboxylate-specific signal transduction histidine kinase